MRISLEEFNKILKLCMNEETELRVGQCLFVELHRLYPKMMENVVGTDSDTFYDDENIFNLMKKITK